MRLRNIVPIFAPALLLLTAVTTTHADALDEITRRGKIVCATQDSNPPYAYIGASSDVPIGFDVDVCAALAKGLGVTLQHKALPSDSRLKALREHDVDLIVGIVSDATEALPTADLSRPYLIEGSNVMVMKGSGIHSLADLTGKKVCVAYSDRVGPLIEIDPTQKNPQYLDAPSCYLRLLNGAVDAFAADDLLMTRFQRQSKRIRAETNVLPDLYDADHVTVAINKGNPALLDAINNILNDLEHRGELDSIYERWLGPETIYQQTRILDGASRKAGRAG